MRDYARMFGYGTFGMRFKKTVKLHDSRCADKFDGFSKL